MGFCFFALLPFMLREPFRSQHAATLRRQWMGLVGIGLFLALNISLNNTSLVLISLSLNQIIRSSIPVITAALAVFIESKVPSRAELGSLVVLTLGVMIAVFEGTVSGSVAGVMVCLSGTVCNAAMMTTSGRLMSEKLDVLRLTFYTAPVSCVALLPFYAWREAAKFAQYRLGRSGAISGIILLGSMNALAYNVVHYLMIQKTSAVSTTVLGEVKVIGLLVLSSMLLGESKVFTTRMTVGCVLAMAGFCGYSHCKLSKQQSSSPIIKGVPDIKSVVGYSRVPSRSAV
ncbi:hypothetical protein WJX72_003780 [[Myrmecia] bisecta]|uniref:Sugar phosphate transporter domain-containing protein n=1 Tax=[Myrmecia] bisecta TaxID=41462 RepID=A0AAW1Q5X7_9CHLO